MGKQRERLKNKKEALAAIRKYKANKLKKANAANKIAYDKSLKQAKKELAKEDVKRNFDKVSKGVLWNLPGSISPLGAEEVVMSGLLKGGKLAKSAITKAVKSKVGKFVGDHVDSDNYSAFFGN